ncbi:UNVERIFIED_CONTAM: hypothetical protein GTU68_061192 [Idotea baltica]|nr:hypothetical protein [Idotea baltica]
MRFDIITIFPSAYESFTKTSIIGKAIEAGKIEVHVHDVRDFTEDKHNKVDDVPYGGGAGMVMTCQPLFDCIEHVKSLKKDKAPVIYLTPQGERLSQPKIETFSESKEKRIIILTGHYEGIDQRVRDALVDQELSIGDYVLTNGDLPAMILADSISRLLPDVIGKAESHEEESFSQKLDRKLEYPHYTRPQVYKGLEVPETLLSGNHKAIEQWKKEHCKEPKKEL